MPVHVKVDLTRLNAKLSSENIIRARKAMATQAHSEMQKYVPSSSKGNHENGTSLRGESVIADDGSYVLYNVPYAKAQFYGFITNHYGTFRIHHYTTTSKDAPDFVNTSRRWDLRMKGNPKDMSEVKKALIRGLLWKKQK